MQTISPADLTRLFDSASEWALLDVRETAEADAGHIYGATFLPRRMLELRLPELVPDRSTTLVMYDEGGTRAMRAAHAADAAGYRDVRVLEGGLRAWQAAGLKLSSGSNVPSKLFGETVYEHQHVPQLPAEVLHGWQHEGKPHVVCDIRTPDEYRVGRIPGAHGAFGVDVALVAADLKARHVPVVVHCAGRTRSIIACQTLRELGVDEVYALENGTMGWQLAGYELERDAPGRMLTPTPESIDEAANRTRDLARSAGADAVDAAKLRAWLERRAQGAMNLYLFDVRQVAAYEAGHIAGSKALPGGLAIQRTDEFIAVRNAHVVLVDDDEARAWMTAFWLKGMGFPHVHVLQGGIRAWLAAGASVETGRPRPEALLLAEKRKHTRYVSPTELAAELAGESRPCVIDVDTSRYFSQGHVAGAHWLPYGWLEDRIDAVAGPHARIVLTCHNGIHSTYAGSNLVAMGYSDVRVLEGGMAKWKKIGLPVDHGLPVDATEDIVLPPYAADRATMARYLEWEQRLTREREQAR